VATELLMELSRKWQEKCHVDPELELWIMRGKCCMTDKVEQKWQEYCTDLFGRNHAM